MNRLLLRPFRFLLLSSVFVVAVKLYLNKYGYFATAGNLGVSNDNGQQNAIGDTHDSAKPLILVYMPKTLFGNQRERTIDEVNQLNREADICHKRCSWTMDRNKTNNADAIVFRFFNQGYNRNDLPMEARRRDQIWAMHSLESPARSLEMKALKGIFNWTISYRKDSDIWTPYGKTLAKKKVDESIHIGNFTLDRWIAGKEELVTQVVSNCKDNSRREVLVEQLKQAGLPVHVYGRCGEELCGPHNSKRPNCYNVWEDYIGRKYKFYFAFENSICTDYITEKFWRTLELGVVPVVYGGGDYLRDGPPNSYIDVRSFSSAKELVQYLLKLDKEPEEYKKLFEWRKRYITVKGEYDWCKFCVALHEWKAKPFIKVNEDVHAWYWQTDPQSQKETACENNPKFFKDT